MTATANGTGDTDGAPAEVVIAPMLSAHVDALMPYERQMFGSEAWTASGYRTELADPQHRYYVVAECAPAGADPASPHGAAAVLLGWAGVMVVADSAEILTVGVIPQARGRGIARVLLAGLLAEAGRRGAVEAFLEVRVDNVPARSLYAREGFIEVGMRPGYYDAGGVDAVVMRREL